MDKKYFFDHVKGAVYGQAIGDSFGIPALLHPVLTAKEFGWIDTFITPLPSHPAHGGMPAGRITDDTEQALEIAKNIIRDKKVTVENTVEAILNWYDFIDGDNSPYVGPSTRKAVLALKQGKDPWTTGTTGDTNGSSMRISVVGAFNAGNPEKAAMDAYTTCVPSHYTNSAISATCAVATAVAKAIMSHTSLDEVISEGMKYADIYQFRGSIWFSSSISRKIQFGMNLVDDRSKSIPQKLQDVYDFIGGGFLASEAIPSAFAMLYLSKGDVMRCAEYCTNMSGDADTIGAIACAMAGAFSGFSSIPKDVVKKVESTNPSYNFSEVAEQLAQLAWEQLNHD